MGQVLKEALCVCIIESGCQSLEVGSIAVFHATEPVAIGSHDKTAEVLDGVGFFAFGLYVHRRLGDYIF